MMGTGSPGAGEWAGLGRALKLVLFALSLTAYALLTLTCLLA